MKRLYLDSNILIAYYAVDKPEETKKQLVENALEVFAHLKEYQLLTSMWASAEMDITHADGQASVGADDQREARPFMARRVPMIAPV